MGKGVETASIVFLLGTSTAGKSTLAREILAQNENLPADQRLDWQVSGHDQIGEIVCNERDEKLLNKLKDNPQFQEIQRRNPKFNEVKPRKPFEPFAAEKIYEAIFRGRLEYQGQTLDLLDEKKFNSQLDEFLAKTDGEFFNKEILHQLQLLTKEKQQDFKTILESIFSKGEERLFDIAIASSKAGKPIILDVIPDTTDGKTIGQRFEEYCQKQNHQCPIHVALVHLPVKELSKRIEGRNAAAIARDEPADQRNGIFPFEQYVKAFKPATGLAEERIVGNITRADLKDAILKFSKLNDPKLSQEDREHFAKREDELREKFGFGAIGDFAIAGDETSTIVLAAIPPFDRVYDITKKEATAEIAEKICALGTSKSQTPTEKHPILEALSSDPKFGEKFHSPTTPDGESFVARLGLKPTKTRETTLSDILATREEKDPQKKDGGRG